MFVKSDRNLQKNNKAMVDLKKTIFVLIYDYHNELKSINNILSDIIVIKK